MVAVPVVAESWQSKAKKVLDLDEPGVVDQRTELHASDLMMSSQLLNWLVRVARSSLRMQWRFASVQPWKGKAKLRPVYDVESLTVSDQRSWQLTARSAQ